MAVSPARAAANQILLKVEREDSYANELLHSSRFAKLSAADHNLATELVMGVLRWRSLLDERIVRASSQKLERLDCEVLTALRMGVYQLLFLTRIPARAAIYESVELVKAARKRSAAPFVNAVLRKVAATRVEFSPRSGVKQIPDEIGEPLDPATLAHDAAHPSWIVARWAKAYGLETTRQICAHNQDRPTTAIRVHDDSAIAELAESGIELSPGGILAKAHTVVSGDVTQTRAYEQGRISIQDEGSQLVAMLVGRGDRILDCCAAPGGKTALLSRGNPSGTIVASELHPHRARLLRGLVKQANVCVVAADARRLPFETRFDRILVDVPCSGTGTLSRNPEIKWRLSAHDLDDLQTRQISILKSVLPHLAAKGKLVYSTCSLEHEENEAVVTTAVAAARGFSIGHCGKELEKLRKAGEITGMTGAADFQSLLAGPYLRTIPGVHRCDGFFAAIIEKD